MAEFNYYNITWKVDQVFSPNFKFMMGTGFIAGRSENDAVKTFLDDVLDFNPEVVDIVSIEKIEHEVPF